MKLMKLLGILSILFVLISGAFAFLTLPTEQNNIVYKDSCIFIKDTIITSSNDSMKANIIDTIKKVDTLIVGDPQYGLATWYGSNGVPGIRHTDNYHGKTTANGEKFDTWAFTAAHLKLPFGTLVKVTNTSTGKSVIVRINDRGPYGNKKRIIDLSYAAQIAIGMSDVASVKVEKVILKK